MARIPNGSYILVTATSDVNDKLVNDELEDNDIYEQRVATACENIIIHITSIKIRLKQN